MRAGATHSTETNVYALNRRTMQAVANPKAYTFKPGNTPNRYASYYVTLPMGLTKTTNLPIWKPESGTTYTLHPAAKSAATPAKVDGLSALWYSGRLPMTAAPAYEVSGLASRGLPRSLTPAQVTALLNAEGIPVSTLEASLLPVLTASQLKTLTAVLSKPVTMQYFIFGSGLVAAEPQTGTILKLENVIDGVAARPDPTALKTVVSILDQHLAVPGVPAAVAIMNRIASAPPAPVYELRYTQTPAAVATMAAQARHAISQMNLATTDLPIGLGILGLLLVSPAAVHIIRRRRAAAAALRPPMPGTGEQLTHRAAA